MPRAPGPDTAGIFAGRADFQQPFMELYLAKPTMNNAKMHINPISAISRTIYALFIGIVET